MTRLLVICSLLLFSVGAMAQKSTLALKKGSVLIYQVTVNGQALEVRMEIDSLSDEYSKFAWSLNGENGTISNNKASILNATRGYWAELNAGSDMSVGDDQNI